MTARIRLLGSVEVDEGETTRRVSADIPRAIVIRLALTPGELVTTEQLVADVWAEAPDAALSTLRAHISRLRGAALGERLVGVRGGYLLDVPRDAVDVVCLRDRAAAIGAPRADEAQLAELAELVAAYEAPLAPGLEGPPFLAAVRERLADERREVEEDLGEAALALGDNVRATTVLEGTVARHPDHERPARLLATSLARSARYSDAIDVLDAFSARLAADGVAASPRIESLRRSIVRLEPAVVAPATSSAATVVRVGLQVPLTRFVGRADALARLRAARADHRLITIVGPAGVGKTRTAVELAREATSAVDDEQYMVDLADVRNPSAVLQTIATSVRAPSATVEAIARRLGDRRVLVLLDNADHVLGASAIAAAGLLEHAPNVRLLVTSREPLRLPAEHEYVLTPFGADEADDAWRLFSERAADVRGGEPFSEAEERLARELCRELEGIPLALELAAARLDVLDVATVRSGLDVWSSEGRHGSVQSAIAWTFDLLDADQQRVLLHAGRFAGPFTSEAFAGIERMEAAHAEAALRGLVGKSLLVPERSETGRPRFRMLESTREFVARRDTGEGAAEWTARHRRWFARLAWSLVGSLRDFGARDAMAVLDGFRSDLDAAMDSSAVLRDRTSAVLLTAGLAHYWHLRGRFLEGRTRLDQALAVPAAPHADDDEDADALALAVPLAELELANLAYQLGDAQAAFVAIAAAEEHGRAADDPSTTAVARARAGYGRAIFGDGEAGSALLAAAMQVAERAEPWAQSEVWLGEGQLRRALGDPEGAIRALTRSHEIAAAVGYTWMVTSARYVLAKALVDARRPREAIAVARETSAWARANEDAAGGLALLHIAAGACAFVERHDIGARLFGAVDALGARYGYSTEVAEGQDAQRLRESVAAGLTPADFDREYRNGRTLSWDDVMQLVDRLPRTDLAVTPAPTSTESR